MAVSVLSQASALNPGSDLWVLPALNESPWTTKLDWYLNFQICKASRHESASVPSYLNEVLKETEQKAYVFKKGSAEHAAQPLMISSAPLLPNKWVVLISQKENWAQEVHEVWKGLKQPSLRVFLPPGQSAGHFQKEWQKYSDFQEFTVVLD